LVVELSAGLLLVGLSDGFLVVELSDGLLFVGLSVGFLPVELSIGTGTGTAGLESSPELGQEIKRQVIRRKIILYKCTPPVYVFFVLEVFITTSYFIIV
jgi:hypothetical protein